MSRKNNLAQIWMERIEACQASGINVKAWCRENNVSDSQYYYWIRKLKNNANEIVGDNSVEWAVVIFNSLKLLNACNYISKISNLRTIFFNINFSICIYYDSLLESYYTVF